MNSVRWDPSGRWLASGSNDMTVALWTPALDTPQHVLSGHKREINAVRWSPAPAGTAAAPGGPTASSPADAGSGGSVASGGSVLASSSADGSVRVWSPETGTCTHILDAHEEVRRVMALLGCQSATQAKAPCRPMPAS